MMERGITLRSLCLAKVKKRGIGGMRKRIRGNGSKEMAVLCIKHEKICIKRLVYAKKAVNLQPICE